MAKKKFKSESKRLLDLMINSIYTHKEIFLRELISNASDALDKLYYLSLKDENIVFDRENFYIRLTPDKEARTLTICDRGIGMDQQELEQNLGTIAKSGSLAFKSENETTEDVDIIGQFGVGFYSAFMVADKVTVKSRKFGSDDAFCWYSEGADGYEIEPCTMENPGTEITLHLKEDSEEENYGEFLEEFKLRGLIRKYSDYIKYPIKMMVTKQRPKETEDKDAEPVFESYQEDDTLNSMVPIWRKNRSELSDEDYQNFYRDNFYDFEKPLKVIHTGVDGAVSYKALLFIPAQPPYDYFTKEFKRGLKLYTNGVLIMDKCEDLLPDYFGFVRGLVDSADLSLNISREILQHDRQLKTIAANLKKKIKNELLSMQKNSREEYEKFYDAFKRPLKFGMYANYGAEKEFLQDLVMFHSSREGKYVTLKEYIERMPEGQNSIYYAAGETDELIARLPQVEAAVDKGFEVLYFTEDVDEFVIKMLSKYADKEFKSVSAEDLSADDEVVKAATEVNKDLLGFIKESLGDKVADVKLSNVLKSHPVAISNQGEISLEMERVLNSMPGADGVKAQRVLEFNMEHKAFEQLKQMFGSDKEKCKKFASLLFDCAMLTEGMKIEDPVAFTANLCDLQA